MTENNPTNTPSLAHFMDRRNFMRTSVLTGAGVYLATSKGAVAQAESGEKGLTAAIVGCGAQGQRLFLASNELTGIKLVAACDIWSYNRRIVAARIKAKYGSCNEYETIEELLAKETNLDCVIIATPDFLHAPYTRLALQAGKAVYCEKMMSNTIEAAADMVKAQRETGGILQIGHQRQSNPRYINLRDNVLNGNKLLGRVTHCYGQWNRGVASSAPLTSKFPVEPAILAKHGYASMEEFLNWRYFKKYGGGPIADLGAHQIGMFNWFFKTTPVSVIATGGVDYFDGTANTDGTMKPKFELPDNVQAIYEFKTPEGITRAYYQVLTTTGSQGYFEKLMGVDGSAVISEQASINQVYKEPNSTKNWNDFANGDNPVLARSRDAVYHKVWEKPKPWTRPDSWMDVPKTDSRVSKGLETWELGATMAGAFHAPHLDNFFKAARKKDPSILTCPVDDAFRTCVTVLKCYESMASGAKYVFKPEDFIV
ncbi:MAG: Gfo/Idh/MocA family oxidoreductase [Verrucomicrobiaceae bacterium]|nr:Gfo/Idh/MocA family oxidoreductase [Verrucomicrobiaceae bacterium]